MKWAIWALALTAMIGSMAHADVSDLTGGAFIAHYVAELPYSSDPPAAGWCEEYSASYAITSPEEQVNRVDTATYAPVSWFVIAAWAEEKTWAGVEFGFGTFNAGLFVFLEHAPCYPPTGGLEIPMAGWPGPDLGIAFTVTGTNWTGNYVPVYWFGGYAYGYGAPGTIALGVDPATDFVGFSNAASPPLPFDVLPDDLGALGINMDGVAVGPTPDQTAACCEGSDCTVLTEQECIDAGGNWLGITEPNCTPNPCGAQAACCDAEDGCTLVSADVCDYSGGVWQSGDTTCEPNPCGDDWACCVGEECTDLTTAECTAAGGQWIEGHLCAVVTCADARACCLIATTECLMAPDPAACEAQGGEWRASDLTCDGVDCSTPVKETSWGKIKALYK